MQQNNFENASQVYRKVTQVINKNKSNDLFHKAFLRPQQIALKTWRTQKDKKKLHDSLPYGLKQVIKKDISLNRYVLKDFQSFNSIAVNNRNVQYVNQNNYDNLISLLKPRQGQGKIQLCICICMYSQDKTMLRKTLAGVSNNIATFVQNGMSADDIVVAVVMDGIEKVDYSVVDFFGQMQKESNIYLDNDTQPLEARQMIKDDVHEVDEQEVVNINNFIFDEVELEDRKKRRFCQRKRQYQEVKKMNEKIEELQMNKKITYEDLDNFLKPFFLDKAREHRKRDYAQQDFAVQKVTQQQLLKQYADNVRISRPIIYESLSQAKSYCQKYIQTRDNLALLNTFRVEVTFGSFQKKKKIKKYQNLTQQQNSINNIKMNLFLITKYKNNGKLSSHNWFFNGLCRQIKSEFAVLLDVGLCPQKTALYKMYMHMKNDSKCGGVCGYMNLRIQMLNDQQQKYEQQIDCLSKLVLHCVDIQRAQQVQYHFAHLIDKPFQALFKFIHVLPGAFSAYRMKALQPSEQEDSKLMREYFKSLQQSTARQLIKNQYSTCKAILKVILPDFLFDCCFPLPKQLSQQQLLYNSNVYLAEDRTLCMGIHQNGYQLQYLPDSHAWVDPIKNLHGLLGQRKRWINGSFFAFESVKKGLKQGNRTDFCLKLQILYLTLMNMLAFVSPALFLFTIHIAMFAFRDWFFGYVLNNISSSDFQTTQFYNAFVYLLDFIYVLFMLGLIFKSIHFTHRTKPFIPFIYGMSTIMGLFSVAVFLVLLVDMIQGIADSIKCMTLKGPCQVTFLAEVPILRTQFFNALPGGLMTFMVYKWLVVGVISLYIFPILIYAIFYCRCQFIIDVLFGTVSFIFYTPTYLNILNTFALCRIDDISWGTKGLDAEDYKNKQLKQSWKSIKILHVAKFIFWNVVVGTAMLVVSTPINLYGTITSQQYNSLLIQSYIKKFFMTFFLMAIIGFALFLKIFLGAMYSIGYRCTHSINDKLILQTKNLKYQSKVDRFFNQIKPSMGQELKKYIYDIVDNVKQKKLIASFSIKDLKSLIIANQKLTGGVSRKKAEQKWNQNVSHRSKIQKKQKKKDAIKPKNNPLKQQPIDININLASPVQESLAPRPTPLGADQYKKQISKNDLKSIRSGNSSEQLYSEMQIRKSSDDSQTVKLKQNLKQLKRLHGII